MRLLGSYSCRILAPRYARALVSYFVVEFTSAVPDPILLTIGQLAWMNYDILLMSLRPLLLEHSNLPLEQVDKLIADAQADLYYPEVRPNICLHIVFALKL